LNSRLELRSASVRHEGRLAQSEMAAGEQYDLLLRLADEFQARGNIDWDERKDLVLEADSTRWI